MSNQTFFQNKDCPYFPCHGGASVNDFNCLFCYCPLYVLGEDCGGNYTYTQSGVKDCSACTLPHQSNGYEHISKQLNKIINLAKE